MTKLLVSVRSVDEALAAAAHGAGFIDLKEPRAGALGALPPATIRAVLAALRGQGSRLPVSATVGDLPLNALDVVLERVHEVAACGVDLVKVGIPRCAEAPRTLQALAQCGAAIVPVFIADAGIDEALLQQACALPFAGLMLDTFDKRAGSLFDLCDDAALAGFVARVRAAGRMAGLAGALRHGDVPRLQALAPDFAGFRSAVCRGDRGGTLDPTLLQALAQALAEAPAKGQVLRARGVEVQA